jgi:intracellular sulfur oxidation DsrE/DsrF family protein
MKKFYKYTHKDVMDANDSIDWTVKCLGMELEPEIQYVFDQMIIDFVEETGLDPNDETMEKLLSMLMCTLVCGITLGEKGNKERTLLGIAKMRSLDC